MFRKHLLMNEAGGEGGAGGGGDKPDPNAPVPRSEFQKVLDQVAQQQSIIDAHKKNEADALAAKKAKEEADLKKATESNDLEKILQHERKLKAELEDEIRTIKDAAESKTKAEDSKEIKNQVKAELGGQLKNDKYLMHVDWDKAVIEKDPKTGVIKVLNKKELADGLRKEFPESIVEVPGKTGADAAQGDKGKGGKDSGWRETLKNSGGLLGKLIE